MARDQETLAQAFLALGENAADAKAMARAEIERGSPQLARSMFLKSAGRLIIDEDKKRDGEVAWTESWLAWGRLPLRRSLRSEPARVRLGGLRLQWQLPGRQ